MSSIQLYDTTLRDGAQREGISFSVIDKLHITQKLDELGIHLIEGGWPGSNPKDVEFFKKAQSLALSHSQLVAFGSTRHPKGKTETDANLLALANAGVRVATIVGKSSELQVTQVLETTPEENLNMIADSIRYLKAKGLTVFFDAEHFFDGFKANRDYSLRCLTAAVEAGADCLVLCDTNGGTLPNEITTAVAAARGVTDTPLGIHAHNDGEVAVANTLAAVNAGVSQVQGTINGYGERCGNANLCSIIPALKLKMNIDCVTDEQLAKLAEVSHYVSEVANLVPDAHLPYVGSSAFTHKAGLHVSGLMKWAESYQHIDPLQVGNRQKVLVSELSGKKNIIYKAKELGLALPLRGKEAQKLLEQVKLLESRGFQYDNVEASFELLVHRAKPDYQPPFELVDFMVVVEKRRRLPIRESLEEMLSEAMLKVKVGDEIMHTAAEGNGPVNALDQALRKALLQFYPSLAVVKLLEQVKLLESRGFQYDNVEASFELLVHRAKPDYQPPFELVDFMVVVEKRRRPSIQENLEGMLSEAMLKVKVGTEIMHTAAEGNGPVNALDQALRKALLQFYPSLAVVKLVDYKVRILEESVGTESQVRVLIESSDGVEEWRTVGSSTNIIEASWLALADSLEYWLIKQKAPQ